MIDKTKITVSKLDAARRQLRTAIRLWFDGGDPVAIHTLAFAAYEIIHVLSKEHNRYRPTLIFDSDMINDEYRAEWNKSIKKSSSFFKHAKKDTGDSIEFLPSLSMLFLMASLSGLRLMREVPDKEGWAFFYWLCFHEPTWLKPGFIKILEDRISVEGLGQIRTVTKPDFLKIFDIALK